MPGLVNFSHLLSTNQKKGTIVKICAGDSHSAALDDKGFVYVWGMYKDSNGAIGFPNMEGGFGTALPDRAGTRVPVLIRGELLVLLICRSLFEGVICISIELCILVIDG